MSDDEPAGRGDEPDEPRRDEPPNPFKGTPFEAFGTAQGGAGMPGMSGMDLGAVFGQLQQLFSGQSGPVNWNLATEVAKQTIREAGDASLTAAERAQVDDTVRLAEHWLDSATELPAEATNAVAWNRAEWLDGTLPVWKKLIEPVATHVVGAMSDALPSPGETEAPTGDPNTDLGSLTGPLKGVLTQFGGAMFGAQVGQALGRLATEVFGAADIGLPLAPAGHAVLIPANLKAFGTGLGVDAQDVMLYLALRECAHQRLFTHAPWLTTHLISAVEEYARGMQVDVSKLEDAMSGIDPSNPEALQEALSSGMFEPEETPAQKAAVNRVETMLALIEGWVDDVVARAAESRMPSAVQLHEAVRRRRAVGGPAEQTFATLVGLELRPRRLRDAATLWRTLRENSGEQGRDALWAHPDLLPAADDLDDPAAFAERSGSAAFDLGDMGFDRPSDAGADPGESPRGDDETRGDEPGEPGDESGR